MAVFGIMKASAGGTGWTQLQQCAIQFDTDFVRKSGASNRLYHYNTGIGAPRGGGFTPAA
jgi:hypothetical protein